MKAKKALAMLLCAAMVTSTVSFGALAAEETDVKAPSYGDAADSWAASSIERWSASGIVKGDDNGNFNPGAQLSRAELATIFVNMFGLTEKAENTFGDLKGDEWYADAVLKCAAAGIMKGDGVSANAEAKISRAETIVMFGRAVGVTPDEKPDLSKFTDGADVADWAAGYMAPLVKMGILAGVGDGTTISAGGQIDRASTMALLDKSISEYVTAPGEYKADDANKFVVVNMAAKEGEIVISGTTAGVTVSAGTAEGKIVAKDLKADTIKVDGAAALNVEGKSTVGNVVANNTGAVTIAKGVTVDTLDVNAAAKVTNNGTVKTANFNAADSTWTGSKPKEVNSAEGVTPPVKEQPSGGGGGSSDPAPVDPAITSGVKHDGANGKVTSLSYNSSTKRWEGVADLAEGTLIGIVLPIGNSETGITTVESAKTSKFVAERKTPSAGNNVYSLAEVASNEEASNMWLKVGVDADAVNSDTATTQGQFFFYNTKAALDGNVAGVQPAICQDKLVTYVTAGAGLYSYEFTYADGTKHPFNIEIAVEANDIAGIDAAFKTVDKVTLSDTLTVAAAQTLTIPTGKTLIVPQGKALNVAMDGTLTVAGTGAIEVEAGGALCLNSNADETVTKGNLIGADSLNVTSGSVIVTSGAGMVLTIPEGAVAEIIGGCWVNEPKGNTEYRVATGDKLVVDGTLNVKHDTKITGEIAVGETGKVVVAKENTLTLTRKSNVAAVTNTVAGDVEVNGTLDIPATGTLTVAEAGEVAINDGATLKIASELAGTGAVKVMAGATVIVVDGDPEQGEQPLVSANSLDITEGHALLTADTLTLTNGAEATIRGQYMDAVVTAVNTVAKDDYRVTKASTVTVAEGATLTVAFSTKVTGKLVVDGTLEVQAGKALEVVETVSHHKGILEINGNVQNNGTITNNGIITNNGDIDNAVADSITNAGTGKLEIIGAASLREGGVAFINGTAPVISLATDAKITISTVTDFTNFVLEGGVATVEKDFGLYQEDQMQIKSGATLVIADGAEYYVSSGNTDGGVTTGFQVEDGGTVIVSPDAKVVIGGGAKVEFASGSILALAGKISFADYWSDGVSLKTGAKMVYNSNGDEYPLTVDMTITAAETEGTLTGTAATTFVLEWEKDYTADINNSTGELTFIPVVVVP